MTPESIRAGRELIGWSRQRLAGRAGVSASTIRRLEVDEVYRPYTRILRAVCEALEEGGVRFVVAEAGRARVTCRATPGTEEGAARRDLPPIEETAEELMRSFVPEAIITLRLAANDPAIPEFPRERAGALLRRHRLA